MVGVLGSNPSVDTKQISKSLKINNLEIFLFLFWRRFGVIIDFWRSLDPISAPAIRQPSTRWDAE